MFLLSKQNAYDDYPWINIRGNNCDHNYAASKYCEHGDINFLLLSCLSFYTKSSKYVIEFKAKKEKNAKNLNLQFLLINGIANFILMYNGICLLSIALALPSAITVIYCAFDIVFYYIYRKPEDNKTKAQ